jgi:hypothetical protein
MNNNKILLIGIPRCGSQYISQLISRNFKYINLHEPFTPEHDFSIKFVNNKIHLSQASKIYNYAFQLKYVFSILERVQPEDRFVIKYFPFPYSDLQNVENVLNIEIVNKIINLGFTPIILKRQNIEKHLLSYLMARQTGIWYSQNINFKHSKVELSNFSEISLLIKFYEEYYKLVSALDKNISVIEYDTIEQDIKRIFHTDTIFPGTSVKLNSNDPYDDITNTDQVRDMMSKYVDEIRQIKNKYE